MNILFGILASVLTSCVVDSQAHYVAVSPRLLREESAQREAENPSGDVTVETIFHSLEDLILSVELISDRLINTWNRVKAGELLLNAPADVIGYDTALQNLTDTSMKLLAGVASVKKILSEDNPTFPIAAIQNNVDDTLQSLMDNTLKLYSLIDETKPKLQEISHLSFDAFRSQENSKYELMDLQSKLNTFDVIFMNEFKELSGTVDEAHILLGSYPTF